MITSRLHNPRAKGKEERSHRELQKKIHYDIVKLKSTGVNWVEHLRNYMRVLNDLAKERHSWHSHLEIYYGHVSNFIKKKDNIEEDGIIPQHDIDFRLQDSFTISKTLEHTEKISLNAEKCGKIG